MMVWLLFIIDLMGLFFYNKIGSIISIGDLPTTNIIEPFLCGSYSILRGKSKGVWKTKHLFDYSFSSVTN